MRTKINFYLFGLILFLLMTLSLQAENHYVRVGATGNNDGSDWENAYSSFVSVVWTRGDTYYVASGTYDEVVLIRKDESGTTWINVLKATADIHGTNIGWNADYATGPAIIQKLIIQSSYISVDGQEGSGTSGHGIKVDYTATTSNAVSLSPGKSFIHLCHIEIQGAGFVGDTDYRGLYQNNTGGNYAKGHYWSYLYIHDFTTNGITTGGINGTSFDDYGLIYEYNVIAETGGCTNVGLHGQGWQAGYGVSAVQRYWTIRNSIFKNIDGTANIAFLGYTTNEYIRIYNNIFLSEDKTIYHSSPGVIYVHNIEATAINIEIYNNTFYNIKLNQIRNDADTTSGCEVKNNLFHTGTFTTNHLGVTSQYNAYYNCDGYGVPSGEIGQQNEISDPVVNSSAHDFHIIYTAKAKDNGTDLSSVFSTDMDGITRPQGPDWDIGAYEYIDTTGIDNFSDETLNSSAQPILTLHPNPSYGICIIRLNNNTTSIAMGNKLKIYSIIGVLIDELELIDSEVTWNNNSVPGGIYLMKLKLEGTQNISQKLILIR
jgi:hypothetical protein